MISLRTLKDFSGFRDYPYPRDLGFLNSDPGYFLFTVFSYQAQIEELGSRIPGITIRNLDPKK